jgi:hypothetical protein
VKTTQYNSLGLDVDFSVPATVEEFNQNANPTNDPKNPNPCLDEATNNVIYRNTLANFRYYFLHGISEKDIADDTTNKTFVKGTTPIQGVDVVSGIERKTVPVLKDGKPVIVDGEPATTFDPEDSEAKYFKRVCAEKGQKPEDYQTLANQIASALVFNAAATASKAGPKKLAAKYKLSAGQLLAGMLNFDKFAAAFEKTVGSPLSFTPTNDMTKPFAVEMTKKSGEKLTASVSDKDAETLGWLVKKYNDAADEAAAAARNAALMDESVGE